MRVLLFVVAILGLAAAGDPYAATAKTINTLLSKFCTAAQIKTLTNWLLDQSYDGKTLEDVQDQLIAQGMAVLTSSQKAKVTTMYSKMSEELGGASKAQKLIEILMEEVGGFVKPFADKVNAVMKTQKKAGKAKAACKSAALVQGNKFLNKANIQKAVNNCKQRFTQAQCQIAFKYLAPTYVMLGQYKFLSPPCTGKGV